MKFELIFFLKSNKNVKRFDEHGGDWEERNRFSKLLVCGQNFIKITDIGLP